MRYDDDVLLLLLGSSSALCLYSGLFSVGVADAVASVVGSMFGRLNWPGQPPMPS